MRIEIGMYVRTDDGIIKVLETDKCGFKADNNSYYMFDSYCVLKASYNIIDLIKRNDILLSKDGKIYQCNKIYKDYVFTNTKNKYNQTVTLVDYQIDKILTKEQFEKYSYKLER